MGKRPPTQKRRTVLKTIGAGMLGTTVVPTVAAKNSGSKYTGVAYDPVTHEILGDASAQMNGLHSDLTGNLRVGNKKFNMNKLNTSEMTTKSRNKFSKTKHKFKKDKKNLSKKNANDIPAKYVSLTAVDDGGIGGYFEKNRRKVAFTLRPKGHDSDWKSVLQQTKLQGDR